jgi:hypothetical protein
MTNLFKENAYNILGLDSSTTQKEALKRSKAILRVLQIDEIPEYGLEIGAFNELRTEESVKSAIQRLASPKKQIIDYFFWFYINDEIDQQSLDSLILNDIDNAILHWSNNSADDSIQSILRKKNLAILYSTLLFKSNNQNYIEESINLWSEILNSSKFWDTFTKLYKLNDELSVDQEIISAFHRDCESYLHDLYVELYELHKDESYLSLFNKKFKFSGNISENKAVSPILDQILKAVEELESMDVSADGVFDDDEAQQIEKCISVFNNQSEKLNNLSLYENSEVKVLRDRAVNALRDIALDIHNNLSELPKAQELLKIALKFVGTSGLESTLKQDLDTFEQNEEFHEIFDPIEKLINEKFFVSALEKIDEYLLDDSLAQGFRNAFILKKKECITIIAMHKFTDADHLYECKEYRRASEKFLIVIDLIYNNIETFDVNKTVIDQWISQLNNYLKNLNSHNVNLFDDYMISLVKILNEKLDGTYEHVAMLTLIRSLSKKGIGNYILKNKSTSSGLSGIPTFFIQIIAYIIIASIFYNCNS